MEAKGPGEGRILEKLGDSVGLNLARQGLLRRDVGLRKDTGTRGNDGIEGGLGRSETAPLVKVQGVKGGPDGGAEIAACGEAANVGSRGLLAGGPGADPTRGDAKGRQAPVVVRKRGANEASEGRADVGVSGEEAAGCASGGTVRHE